MFDISFWKRQKKKKEKKKEPVKLAKALTLYFFKSEVAFPVVFPLLSACIMSGPNSQFISAVIKL